MGNILFCPELHQAGIEYASGAGILLNSHVPLSETYGGKKELEEEAHNGFEPSTSRSVRFDLPQERRDLAYHGFDYRLTKLPSDEQTKTGTQKDSTDDAEAEAKEFNFSTRLYHTESNTIITKDNYQKYGLRGELFGCVSTSCQDIVQQELHDVFRYAIVKIPTSSSNSDEGGITAQPIQAYVSPDLAATISKNDKSETTGTSIEEKPILLIIGGKGKSRAGVLSVKQLLVSGVESGSAMFHILQAEEQQMSVILLDPNACGESRGMEVVNHSLTYFFGAETAEIKTETMIPSSIGLSKRPLYIIAHSAAGGYLTTYLSQGVARETLLRQSRRIAFTDSTHNLQWYKTDQRIWDYLQSPKCLYIRNNSAHRIFGSHVDKQAGEKHEGDHWWHHRYGNIPTVWAGTPEHSLICWAARHVIWNFFADEERFQVLYS